MLSKKTVNEIRLAIILLGFSCGMYLLHFYVFRDLHHIFLYLIGDIAFLGIDALLVYFVLDRLLASHEKAASRKRLNILAGLFFSDVGVVLVNLLLRLQKKSGLLAEFCVQESWTKDDFMRAYKGIAMQKSRCQYDVSVMVDLKVFLSDKKEMLVRLLENPGLHEHESFSDMLLAVFHITEELLRRHDLQGNDKADQDHLAIDADRAFVHLARLWLEYMEHLRMNYQYLYKYNIRNRQFVFQ